MRDLSDSTLLAKSPCIIMEKCRRSKNGDAHCYYVVICIHYKFRNDRFAIDDDDRYRDMIE